jgi:Zn-dependent protease/predicted transcriptional regulator
MRGRVLFRVSGIPVRADGSLALLAVFITWELWQFRFTPDRFSELSSGKGFLLAVVTTALFLGSILAHELAHAGMFRARGIEVRGITLYMFGGLTAPKTEARRPSDEFLVSVVGPLTTAVVGGVFLLMHEWAATSFSRPVDEMFLYLGFLNVAMAILNVLPGFPLDGGRLVLAGVWRLTGNRTTAIGVAARIGQVVAVLIGVGGLMWSVSQGSGVSGGLWFLFIAWLLFQGATGALGDVDRRRVLGASTAGQVMSPPPPVIPSGMTVGEAVERYLEGHEGEAFPVFDEFHGRVIGFISPRMARGVDPSLSVRDAMVGTEAVVSVSPHDPMDVVLQRLEEGRAQVALVSDGGRLVGVIEREDLTRFFGRQRAASTQASPPRPDLPGTD